MGDENELDIDFDVFRGSVDGSSISHGSRPSEPTGIQETQDEEDTKQSKGEYRSKDAGKTCKERFSYASFDAGATVLKTHPGAKNAKAVLVENKDSYMLSECSAENKFIIIELSVRLPFSPRSRNVYVLISCLGRYMDRHCRPCKL